MPTEKEKLLAVATLEEWDCWLTKVADNLALENICNNSNCDTCSIICGTFDTDCLFCKTFDSDCRECCGRSNNDFSPPPCEEIPWNERIDAAIARLERAGVFED